jgi:NitT/TauT family transport system permease protein
MNVFRGQLSHTAERALGIALFLFAWATLAAVIAKPQILPGPAVVAETLYTARTTFAEAALRSFVRVAVGWGAAVILAVPIGWAMGAVPVLNRELSGFIALLRPIPPFAWLPLLLIWVGIGDTSAWLICFVAAVFPILSYARAGVAEAQPALLQAARNLGASGLTLAARVQVPAALPMTFTGLRSGWMLAWMSLVAAELAGADGGLGQLILDARNLVRPDLAIGGMAVIGALAASSASLLGGLERRVPGCG